MGTRRRWLVLLAVFVVSPASVAQSDTEPPVLVDFDFNPKNIDVTTGPADVTCDVALADTPSGVDFVYCRFDAPTPGVSHDCRANAPSVGNIYGGTWTCSVTIPQFAEEGTWKANLNTYDNAGNHHLYQWNEIEQLGFPTFLDVLSDSDSDAPSLTNFDFNPKNIDVTTGPADVTCDVALADTPSGVDFVYCRFDAPTPGVSHDCRANAPSVGNIYGGTWTCSVTIPQFAEEGTWKANLNTYDNAGNHHLYQWNEIEQLGFPTFLDVLSDSDSDAPSLTNFDFNPKNIDVTTGPADVTCDVALADTPSGVDFVYCRFDAPTPGVSHDCRANAPSVGNIYGGTWTCSVTIPQFAEEGTWKANLNTYDNAGNHHLYQWNEIEQLGLPAYLSIGFLPGRPLAALSHPKPHKHIRGNSVTVRARLAQGSPADVSPTRGIRFDYRALPFGEFAPIPARNSNHPNPDTSYPYFTHWDVSGVPEGDFELRAVAHDLVGTPDPAPETITITIDHAGPADVEEYINSEGRQENQTAVDSASENKIASGDHTDVSTATELTLPPGSLLYTTDTAKLVYPDPANEEGQLEQVEQSIGAFVDLSLLSGQADLESGSLGDLNISFADSNQDGVVDGTSIREEDLELRYLDPGTNSYVVLPSIVLTEHNMVHAEPGFLGKFALAGPLMPRMWIETDKETLTWDAVSTATSYVVYRGLLSTLVDTDADGLPDSGFGDCMNHLDINPADLLFVDPDDPGGGEGFLYLVSFVGSSGPVGLGNTSTGLRREPSVTCP